MEAVCCAALPFWSAAWDATCVCEGHERMPAACKTSNSLHAHFARPSLDPRAAAAAGPLPLARASLQRP
eukprot:12181398-Alexandrium_andersonii.AAC.1